MNKLLSHLHLYLRNTREDPIRIHYVRAVQRRHSRIMRDFVQVHALVTRKDTPRLQHLAASARGQVLPGWEQDVVVVQTLHILAHKDAVNVIDELALGGVDEAPLAHIVGVQALVAD